MGYRITDKHSVPANNIGMPLKYPFDKLLVGQSFDVTEDEKLSARRAAHQYGERHGHKFKTRGRRIWRVA